MTDEVMGVLPHDSSLKKKSSHEGAVEENVRMRAERELIASVGPDGHLELFSPRTGMRHRCGPTGTTVWIALQQQNWQTARAAEVIASHWGIDPETIRCDIDAWVGHFRAAGQ